MILQEKRTAHPSVQDSRFKRPGWGWRWGSGAHLSTQASVGRTSERSASCPTGEAFAIHLSFAKSYIKASRTLPGLEHCFPRPWWVITHQFTAGFALECQKHWTGTALLTPWGATPVVGGGEACIFKVILGSDNVLGDQA